MDIALQNILKLIESTYENDSCFEKDFGVARSTVSAWRRGKLKSYSKMLPNIATHFNVSVDYLLGNGQQKKPTVKNDELSEELLYLKSVLEQLSPDDQKRVLEQAQVYAKGLKRSE